MTTAAPRRPAGARPLAPAADPSEAVPRGLRRPGLAVLAVALQAAPGLPGGHLGDLREPLVIASGFAIAAWFFVNLRSTTGAVRNTLAVALAGAAMNLAVMVPNGGMPVDPEAMAELDAAHVDVSDGHLYKHRVADEGTVLAFLGDVVPVRPLGMVVSLGDFVLLAGLLGTGAALALRRDRTA